MKQLRESRRFFIAAVVLRSYHQRRRTYDKQRNFGEL
jgi:hypothetical protein